ncbi:MULTISPECIES: hypothetical protein [unclassified Streptomyces]|uniref:hypothetical protein n=1 Tax=unclassified Streptomyces TaxID=2593676 RepID=UPI00365470A0
MDSPLPVHPLTGARALGWRKARPGEEDERLYPIWPIRGGAPEGEDDDGQGDDGQDPGDGEPPAGEGGPDGEEADPEGADDLGDRGKRALAAMKGKWRAERDRAKELEQRLAEKDGEGEADTARRKAEQDAVAKANTRIVKSEVKAAAKGVLADPADAFKFLDLDQFEVGEDGNIDEDEIADAIADLVKSKPYLAAAPATRFQGTGDGGAARKASRPKQLRANDLKTMTAEQIVKAQDAGQLDDYLGAG